jgi:hypothetical protein
LSQITKNLTSGGPIPPNIPTSFLLDDGNSAVPVSNVVIVHGDTGVDTSLGASNEIVITVTNDGFEWSEQNVSFAAAIQNGYFCNAALTATLPASGGLVIGNSVIFFVDTSDQVIIQAGAGEFIQVSSTISGSGGTATSNTRGSILELVFKPSDLTWHTISSLGSWTVV